MRFLNALFSELFGLFVEDGRLAVLSLALIAAVTVLVKLLAVPALAAAALLLVGCLAILAFSVYRAARRG